MRADIDAVQSSCSFARILQLPWGARTRSLEPLAKARPPGKEFGGQT